MNMTTAQDISQAFQLKGSLFTLTVMHLLSADLDKFTKQLTSLVQQTPKFFHYMPVVLDLQKINGTTTDIDFIGIIERLREHHVIPVGIRGGNSEQQAAAIHAGLAILPNTKTAEVSETNAQPDNPNPTTQQMLSTHAAKLITQPVRSGQQIYARNSDLIILAPVSPGAELLADGNIHVYGPLRGRALAGVTGNQQARIFCQSLDAELIAIAGHYWVSEDLQNNTAKDNVHIYLENDRLHVKSL